MSGKSTAGDAGPGRRKAIRTNLQVCSLPFIASILILFGAISCQFVFIGGGKIDFLEGNLDIVRVDDLKAPAVLTIPQRKTVDAARISWVSSSFLHIAIAMIAIVGGGVCLHQVLVHSVKSTRRRVGIAILCVALAIIIGFFLMQLSYRQITDQLIQVISQFHKNGGMVRGVTKIYDWLTFTTGAFLVTVCCLILIEPDYRKLAVGRNGQVDEEKANNLECAHLSLQSRLLRTVLYLGTAVLISAVFRVNGFFEWGAAFYPDSEQARSLQKLLQNAAMTWGTYSTFMLVAMYLPAACLLRARSLRFAERVVPDMTFMKCEEWLKERGLSNTPTEQLPRVAAIIAPFVVGQVGDIVQKLN